MAKKKMTKAQAAAARYEETPNSIARKKAKEDNEYMREVRRRAQKKASRPSPLVIIVPIVLVIAVIALAFIIVPGLGNIVSG